METTFNRKSPFAVEKKDACLAPVFTESNLH